MNLAEKLLEPGLATPDRLAMSVVGLSRADRWSHARLRDTVLRIATGLAKAGLSRADHLLLPLSEHPDRAIAWLGAIAAGIVPVTVPLRQNDASIAQFAAQFPTATLLVDRAAPHSFKRTIDLATILKTDTSPLTSFAEDASTYILVTSRGEIRPSVSGPTPLPDLTPQDRLLQPHAFAPDDPIGAGILSAWAIGATALIPASGVTPAQIPLLGARHGATLLVASVRLLDEILASDWRPWSALRHALTPDTDDRDPGARWSERTGTPLIYLT
ncbi:AMP-binding protein [Paracoccus aestuariivivens]|uniref:AMP-binding protein n=1 Tax=Paracoccus aestuariivivens TaxID=1820333 RepID=A0A6L6JDZ8_9RHOB|nr:AMP-binding protein [Paracoccus aestuariivivens]MTH80220.1 AMP-binding protein [Paracoccus aestuariivivens]